MKNRRRHHLRLYRHFRSHRHNHCLHNPQQQNHHRRYHNDPQLYCPWPFCPSSSVIIIAIAIITITIRPSIIQHSSSIIQHPTSIHHPSSIIPHPSIIHHSSSIASHPSSSSSSWPHASSDHIHRYRHRHPSPPARTLSNMHHEHHHTCPHAACLQKRCTHMQPQTQIGTLAYCQGHADRTSSYCVEALAHARFVFRSCVWRNGLSHESVYLLLGCHGWHQRWLS